MATDGVTQGVVNSNFDDEILETAGNGVTQILAVNARQVVRRIVDSAHRHTAPVSVGVEHGSGAESGAYGVAKGVVNSNFDDEILETSGNGMTQILTVHARQVVRRIVHSAHRHTAEMIVGVEHGSGTEGGAEGVAKGVVHSEVDV